MTKINYQPVIITVVATFFLMVVSLYNGYPLYDGDTHAYVATAFSKNIPHDRTPFYGMFIRFSSLKSTLWLTIFVQSLILASLLTRYVQLLYKRTAGARFILSCVICITAFTSVSWLASCLMSDVFTPVVLLGVLLFLFDGAATRIQRALYFIITFIAISTHSSHFLIVSIFSACLLLFALIRKNREWMRKSLVLMATAVGFYVSMCSLNYSRGNGFTFSTGTHMFIVAKFAESGILNKYLEENCSKKNLKLCALRNEITPYPWDLMWPREGSPLNKLGSWEDCKPEFNIVIHDVFTTPKYMKLFAETAVISTIKQLTLVGELDKPVNLPWNSMQRAFVVNNFAHEEKEFERAKQNKDEIDPSVSNTYYYLFFVLSSIWVLLFYSRTDNKMIFHIYCCLLVFLVINAFVTSVFSTVHYRFQSRIFWLLPATNAVLLLKYLQKRYFNNIQAFIRENQA